LLDVALGGGAAGGAEFIAGKLVKEGFESSSHTLPAWKEFVKASFEEGIAKGVETGREMLSTDKSEAVKTFIDSQIAAVRAMHHENQTRFIKVGRGKIKTIAEAETIERAFSPANTEAAGRKQRDATRHAWLSYLAQSKFGAAKGPGGSSTTIMATAEQREKANHSAPHFFPSEAPSTDLAMRGEAPGVLSVVVKLPDISNGANNSVPVVEMAFLNGVNQEVRAAYQHKPLASLPIPRHVDARVEGAMPSFSLNIDENGEGPSLTTKQAQWLRARALLADPSNVSKGLHGQQIEGIKLLLQDIAVNHIRKPLL
jgi:hypothetical protein